MIRTSSRALRAGPLALLVVALVFALLAIPASPAAAQSDNNLSVIKDNEAPSNAEIAARLTEETEFTNVERVLISRDDNFADALAGGLMQSNSPLLLVPSSGPVSDRVLAQIDRLGADSATILGGVAAVGNEVTTQLTDEGLTVNRREGGSRVETAIDIARNEAPNATTAILARAFAADPDNPTQAFADALGAGALAARNGWPILLSSTEELSAATMDYLAESDITEVQIVGGTAALSQTVEGQINGMGISTERIAGENRAETALEIAKAQGADDATDVNHIILVDGTSENGWAGGFAAAGRAALLEAPILLADGVRLLPETREFLEPVGSRSGFAQENGLSVTCVVHPLACTEGRRALGLSDYPLLSMTPLRGQVIRPGQPITATLTPAAEAADSEVLFDGNCIEAPSELVQVTAAGQAQVMAASQLPPSTCVLNITYEGEAGAVLRTSTAYVTEGAPFRTADQVLLSSGVVPYGDIVPRTPVYVNDTITCTPPGGSPVSREAFAVTAQYQQEDAPGLDVLVAGSDQVITTRDAVCEASITPPTGVGQVLWGVYSQTDSGLRIPLALGTGTEASFDLAALGDAAGADLSDLAIQWVLRVTDERPIAPPPPLGGPEGVVVNRDGLPIVCNGELLPSGPSQPGPGVSCVVEEVTNTVNYLLVQPDVDVVSAANLEFTTLADPRPTLVSLQILANPRPEPPGQQVCELSTPLTVGMQGGGTVEVAGSTTYHTFSLAEETRVRIRANNPFGPTSDGLDPVATLFDSDGNQLAENDDEQLGVLTGSVIDATLPAGEYCLGVSGFGDSTGEYLVAVDPWPVFVQDVEVFDQQGEEFEFFTYDGTQGDQLVLELRQTTFDDTDPFMVVFNDAETEEDLQVLAESNDEGGAPNARIEFTMPYTGRIVIGTGSLTNTGQMVYAASNVVTGSTFAAASTPLDAPAEDALMEGMTAFAGQFE
ncbi:DVUA0089 family protein [Euzebya tangerina]|uniref:DVUA0089 family protein n=1 Tax=Euzebya tangerina TaxID=591198 RepID=UPI000E31F578|nr:DVUA0089 family protein [Euzebya tangerina]